MIIIYDKESICETDKDMIHENEYRIIHYIDNILSHNADIELSLLQLKTMRDRLQNIDFSGYKQLSKIMIKHYIHYR